MKEKTDSSKSEEISLAEKRGALKAKKELLNKMSELATDYANRCVVCRNDGDHVWLKEVARTLREFVDANA